MDYTEQYLFNKFELKPNSYFEYPHYFYFLKRVKNKLYRIKLLRRYLYDTKIKIGRKQFFICIWLFKHHEHKSEWKINTCRNERLKIFKNLIIELFKMNNTKEIIELLEIIYASIRNIDSYASERYTSFPYGRASSYIQTIISDIISQNYDFDMIDFRINIYISQWHGESYVNPYKPMKRYESSIVCYGHSNFIFNYHDINFLNNMICVILSLQNKLKDYIEILLTYRLLYRMNCYMSNVKNVLEKFINESNSYTNHFLKRNERNKKNTYDIIYDTTKHIPQFGDCLIDMIMNYI